jgi:hypothetical protein
MPLRNCYVGAECDMTRDIQSINQATIVQVSIWCVLRAACCARTGTVRRPQVAACRKSRSTSSKREHSRVLPCSKHIHKRLAHEKSNRNTDRDCDHSTPDIDPVPGCCDRTPSSLRQTRLGMSKEKGKISYGLPILFGTNVRVQNTRTGTKKSTPVTMTVNAVPPNIRE